MSSLKTETASDPTAESQSAAPLDIPEERRRDPCRPSARGPQRDCVREAFAGLDQLCSGSGAKGGVNAFGELVEGQPTGKQMRA